MSRSGSNSETPNVWYAARAPEPLPALPPGKKYGNRIGGWGPYEILDDVPEPEKPSG